MNGSSKRPKCDASIGIHTYGVEAPLAGLLGPRGRQGRGETVAGWIVVRNWATLKRPASSPYIDLPILGCLNRSPFWSLFHPNSDLIRILPSLP